VLQLLTLLLLTVQQLTLACLHTQVRMLAAAKPLADSIGASFKRRAQGKAFDPDVVARKAYAAVWPAQARLQRDFHVFGGEFLMQQASHCSVLFVVVQCMKYLLVVAACCERHWRYSRPLIASE
jgi:hypothetical protein